MKQPILKYSTKFTHRTLCSQWIEINESIVNMQAIEHKITKCTLKGYFKQMLRKSHIITKMSQVIMKITYKEIFYDSLEKRLKMYPNYFLNYVVET